MDLSEIRASLLSKRDNLSEEYIAMKSSKMTKDIRSDIHYKEANIIYLYSPFRNEISTEELIVKALNDGKTVALPATLTKGDMVFIRIDGNPGFHKGKYKILEPIYDPKRVIDGDGLMIVPLVGFSGKKRIGYGRQYYNNYLNNRKSLYTIGIGYDFQEVETIPFDERDIELDEIRSY